MRVLLVDDELDVTSTLKRGLEYLGFKVTTFNRPTEVPDSAAKECDIAILDIRMPDVNGFQLARELWKNNDKLQICFLSAFEINRKEAQATLPNLKSHCFLTKPLLPSEVARHIQTHFEKH